MRELVETNGGVRLRGCWQRLTLVLAAGTTAALSIQAELPAVRVRRDGQGFVTAEGRPFVPFGVNYFRPGTGWAPQVWKQFDEAATREDFARLRALGANCVRVFLTFGSFMTDPGVLNPEGVARLDRFLALAEAAGLYVHPTGPDHWEGLPEWARGDRLAEERVLTALESFWRQLAARYRGRGVLFAYDLLNEPEVRWDTPAMRDKWNRWLLARYPDPASLATAWQRPATEFPRGAVPVPEAKDAPDDPVLVAFQRFREAVAEDWIRRQTQAIRAADPEALVTVGLIQWSVPVVLAGPRHYSAFRPERIAPMLDFMEIHFYPLADGAYAYRGPEDEAKNLAYLECVVREVARFRKPTVIAEFGWYGGGTPRHVGGVTTPATEEQQARWCRQVVERTAGLACGWLNWGLYDQPEARDVSELIGLAKPGGQLKAWGREFRILSARLPDLINHPRRPGRRPALDWDACILSARARAEFNAAYLKAWRQDPSMAPKR